MEDLFEALFGEFEDEFDRQETDIRTLPDGSILAEGRARIQDLNQQVQLNLPEGSYETIAGYLTTSLGRIPFKGERIQIPFGQVIIKKATSRRIDQVHIYPGRNRSSVR
jgi:CBS domain containing-hemolysin-like protein